MHGEVEEPNSRVHPGAFFFSPNLGKVMRALRGQNAGERERLRQEHLRMETLQVGVMPMQLCTVATSC